MLENFFQLGPIPANAMDGNYNMELVILSYVVATFASYIALDITGRLRDVGNTALATTLWLIGGSIAMGVGIWSMHFIGMLAFSMPHMAMSYDTLWTGISMLVAVFASAFALFLLKSKHFNLIHMALGGVVLGLAIASMHYTGMYAMTVSMNIHYLPGLFILSIIIAIVASEAALWLAIKSNQVVMSLRFRLKSISALIMGAAICGMHYTGMSAAVFTPLSTPEVVDASTLNPQFLSIWVAMAAFGLLTIAIFASTYKEAKNQQLLSIARQAGMAEVAATVLHNVGNVLNSVNVSAALVSEKLKESKLNELGQLNQLFKENENNLSDFFANDARAKELPRYIDMLSTYWDKERNEILNETSTLTRNIDHIRHIIGMQQNLSRTTNPEQVTAVDTTIDEALLIAGLNNTMNDIKVHKNYTEIEPIVVDKVKLLQILVNLINNAKDSLRASGHPNKNLDINITHPKENGKIAITIKDNGIGISNDQLTSIFSYGFTTKKDGHGFGLHTSALAAKEMGGNIKVRSEGLDRGASFELELPYKIKEM